MTKTVLAALVVLSFVLPAPPPARAERMDHVTIHVQNKAKEQVTLTMHDDRSGQTFVVRVSAGGKRSILLESNQSMDDCCGAVSWESSDGSRNQHRPGLKNGDVIAVP